LKKILYLTFNDAPSGIFSGQVIDVCLYWKELGFDVTLVSFISLRNFKVNKNKIKNAFPKAIVVPMFPKARNWRLNSWFLGRKIKKINPEVIVCRGVFATLLAMEFRSGRKICFDARGAYEAELNEYDVIPDEKVKSEISKLERKAVLESDFRLAVSNQLVNYWKDKFSYHSDNHVIVPCTLNGKSLIEITELKKAEIRKNLGFTITDTVIVYSGSSAGWQSLKRLDEAMIPLFDNNAELKLLLLTNEIPNELQVLKKYPDRVKSKWLKSDEVGDYLSVCDYGWLVRENTVTNQVASPVKFAEYLAAGLEVIISENLGDYSKYVIENNVGMILSSNPSLSKLLKPDLTQKKRIMELAKKDFLKENYRELYFKLLS
jgi:hypothetical protein